MNEKIRLAVENYQCPGCVSGHNISCYVKSKDNQACDKHCAGTTIFPHERRLFLGMPKGFCRLGVDEKLKIKIFETMEEHDEVLKYDKFNVPVWYYKDKDATLIRGYMPRINCTFLHIVLGRHEIKGAREITDKDMEEMD